MVPNPVEVFDRQQPAFGNKPTFASPYEMESDGSSPWKIALSTMSMLARILFGAVFGVTYMYAFNSGVPLGATPLHIVLCVLGYHILMAEAILAMSSEGGWTASIKPLHRKRAHAIMQIVGSILAIIGAFYKMADKAVNFNTTHGIFGLIAVIFTVICLVNGVASYYAYELRSFLPGKLSKVTHICFGIIAFVASSICLIFGLDKFGFRVWATADYADVMIAFVVIATLIVIINPFIAFIQKLRS